MDVCTSHNDEQPTSRKHQKQGQADGRSHAHPQGIRLVPKHENMLRTTPRNSPVPQRSPPSPFLLLTSAWQPPAEGPDHLGTPKALEAGSHVPVVPLQRARLHDPAERRSSGPWHCRGRDRQVCAGRDRCALGETGVRDSHTPAPAWLQLPLPEGLAAPETAGSRPPGPCSPGPVAGVAKPALVFWVDVAAALAGEEAAVQALALGHREEPVGLQAVGAVGLVQGGGVGEQRLLGVLLLNLALQPSEEHGRDRK